MSVYESLNKAQTVALGKRLGESLSDSALILFTGGLGAGKTAFCEGIAQGLGCTDAVSSPTFAIANVYHGGKRDFAHFDLYRLSTEEDLCTAGLYDYLDDGMVIAAEWSENFPALAQTDGAICVDIAILGENERRITITGGAL